MIQVLLISCASLFAIDGDTISCDGVEMRDIGVGLPLIQGYIAPEISPKSAKCAAEIKLGLRAKARLNEFLMHPGVQVLETGSVDIDGKPLIYLQFANNTVIGGIMIQEGLAQEWTPDYESDWCE